MDGNSSKGPESEIEPKDRKALETAHPSLAFLLPLCAKNNQETTTEPNPLEKKLDAATAALLETHTRSILRALDPATPKHVLDKLTALFSKTGTLTFSLLPVTFPCKDYFKVFCPWAQPPSLLSLLARLQLYHGRPNGDVYAAIRILTVCSVARALQGTGRSWAVLEFRATSGLNICGVQSFKWKLRGGRWEVGEVKAWRGSAVLDGNALGGVLAWEGAEGVIDVNFRFGGSAGDGEDVDVAGKHARFLSDWWRAEDKG